MKSTGEELIIVGWDLKGEHIIVEGGGGVIKTYMTSKGMGLILEVCVYIKQI